jgi:hypothetical protein
MAQHRSDEKGARFYRTSRSSEDTETGAYIFEGGCARYVLVSTTRPRNSVVRLLKQGISLHAAPAAVKGGGTEL